MDVGGFNQFTPTFTFKDLIPDFETFNDLWESYMIEPMYLSVNEMERLYRILYNNYCNCSVAYDTPGAFYRMFFLELYNCGEDYIIKMNMIRELRQLSIDELVKEYETISNVANNDNEMIPSDNPLYHIVPYITTQSTSASKSNKANAIVKALSAYRDNKVKYFVDRFKYLFITIFGDNLYYYCNNEGGC